MGLFDFYSLCINGEYAEKGPAVVNYLTVKRFRAVRKEILKLLAAFVGAWKEVPPAHMHRAFSELLAGHLANVLHLFCETVPELKDAEVVGLYSATFERLSPVLDPQVLSASLERIFGSVLPMINENFQSFPDMRLAFFGFIKVVVTNCFSQLFAVPEERFKMLVYSVAWSFKHDLTNISEVGLELMEVMLTEIGRWPEIADRFYSSYFTFILDSILEVIFDGFHRSGFKQQSRILMALIRATHSGLVRSNLFPGQTQPNFEALFNWMTNSCATLFTALSLDQTRHYMAGLFQAAAAAEDKEVKVTCSLAIP